MVHLVILCELEGRAAHTPRILQERFQYKKGGEKKQEEFEISNFSPSGHDSGRRCGGRLSKKGEREREQDILRFKVGGQKMDEKLLRRKGRRDRKKKERCTINVNRSH